jgi:transcriptional regulator with XRE-family HTH domain
MEEFHKIQNQRNVQIGFNLRCAMLRAKRKNRRLTHRQVAAMAQIHEVSLSRVLAGFGASVQMITKIAEVIGADPKRILSNGMPKPKYKARSFDELVNNPEKLYQFMGFKDLDALYFTRKKLVEIINALKQHRIKLEQGKSA